MPRLRGAYLTDSAPAAEKLARENPQYAFVTPDGTCYQANDEGGNDDLRVPYIGYAAESIAYRAAGVDAYNALQAHVEKRISHGIQAGVSYTFSHALDEQKHSVWFASRARAILGSLDEGATRATFQANWFSPGERGLDDLDVTKESEASLLAFLFLSPRFIDFGDRPVDHLLTAHHGDAPLGGN